MITTMEFSRGSSIPLYSPYTGKIDTKNKWPVINICIVVYPPPPIPNFLFLIYLEIHEHNIFSARAIVFSNIFYEFHFQVFDISVPTIFSVIQCRTFFFFFTRVILFRLLSLTLKNILFFWKITKTTLFDVYYSDDNSSVPIIKLFSIQYNINMHNYYTVFRGTYTELY